MYSMTKFKILPKIEDFAEKEDENEQNFRISKNANNSLRFISQFL